MLLLNWLASWRARSQSQRRRLLGSHSPARLRHARRERQVESLESRWLLSTITVTTANDNVDSDGLVSLREAIQAANSDTSVDSSAAGSGADTIVFDPSLTASGAVTINLSLFDTGLDNTEVGPTAFIITSDITIQGATGDNGVAIARDSAASNFRLFQVKSGAALTLNDLTLSNGRAVGGNGGGGAGSSGGGGAGLGGAIFNTGTLTINHSTISGNTALGGNGGNTTAQGAGASGGGGLGQDGFTAPNPLGGAGGGPNGGAGASYPGTGSPGGYGGGGGGGPFRRGAGAGGFGGGGGGGGKYNKGGVGGFGGGAGGGGGYSGSGASGGFGGGNAGAAGLSFASGGPGGGAGFGGGVFNNGGMVVITNSTIAGNTVQGGAGGVGVASFNGTGVNGDAGSGFGGGLFNRNGTVTITNATIASNTADDGGGIYNLGDAATATLSLTNTIVANSTATTDLVNNTIASGSTSLSGSNNLVETNTNAAGVGITLTSDPQLKLLGNYGGPTATFALQAGSPAIDAGLSAAAIGSVDQRGSGFPRIVGAAVDLGAFEFGTDENLRLIVTTTNDELDATFNAADLSLREAIAIAELNPGSEVITFSPSLTASGPATISLTLVGDSTFGPTGLFVNSSIEIDGPTGSNGLTITRDGGVSNLRLFAIGSSGHLTLKNLTLSNGHAQGGNGGFTSGGGAAGLGGAIFNQGELILQNSTLSGNTVLGGNGGGSNSQGFRNSGGGGGGLATSGANGGSFGGPPGAGGTPNGGAGGQYTTNYGTNGVAGGFGGGGGGGGSSFFAFSTPGTGGNGGFGGGSGGGGSNAATSLGFQYGFGAAGTAGFGAGAGAAAGDGGGGAGLGGAIFNHSGTITITNSTLSGNSAQGGSGGTGGFSSGGAGSGLGGALFNLNGSVTLVNSTVANNTATTGGGLYNLAHEAASGITASAASLVLQNTIVADSTATSDVVNQQRAGASTATVTATAPNIVETAIVNTNGTVNSSGVLAVDPSLQALANNGGPTQTQALSSVSAAINRGNNGLVSGTTDQRGSGFARILGVAVDLGAFEAESQTLVVTTLNDELDAVADPSDLSLREALAIANARPGNDGITFDPSLTQSGPATITLTLGELTIADSVIITGPSASTLTIDANHLSRVFNIDDGSSGSQILVELVAMTLTGGNASDGGGISSQENLTIRNSVVTGNSAGNNGGGIFNQGSLSFIDGTISGNTSSLSGGGLHNDGTATVTRSTVSGNHSAFGAGFINNNGRTMTFTNSTLSGNTSNGTGVGFNNAPGATLTMTFSTVTGNSGLANGNRNAGTLNLGNTIIAGNSSSVDSFKDLNSFGTLNTLGHNLIGNGTGASFTPAISDQVGTAASPINPLLGPLQNNGGPSNTHALLMGSPAINSGSDITIPSTDQRGGLFPRVTGSAVDIGAYEFLDLTVTTTNDELDAVFDPNDLSLREAIVLANANPGAHTITLPAGTYTLTIAGRGENAAATGDLDITGLLTIAGAGMGSTIIQAGTSAANGIDRVFEVLPGGNATFQSLTIQHGNAWANGEDGGGIQAVGDNNSARNAVVTLSHVALRDNIGGRGAGINNNLATAQTTLTITDSVVTGNEGHNRGGGIDVTGFGTLFLIRSTVDGNTTTENAGGVALHVSTSGVIVSSTINNNSAVGAGGGILTFGGVGGAPLTIINSTISGNSAASISGGIHGDADLTIINSTIVGNTSDSDLNGSGIGGGLVLGAHSQTIVNTIVAGNKNGATPNDIFIVDGDSIDSAINDLIGDAASSAGITHGVNGNIVGNAGSGTLALSTVLNTTLANNGGPTKTHFLASGSPAFNAGSTANIAADILDLDGDANVTEPVPFDQRGLARVSGSAVDIGAVEVQISASNEAPSFTKGANQTVAEDASAQTVLNWATNLLAGPTEEAVQVLNFLVSNDNNSLFSVQPSISANGTLTYTPASNANGSATVTVRIHDNGGTDNSGSDTSAAQTFTITVTEVNDAPSGTNDSLTSIAEDSGIRVISFASLLGNDVKGPSNESSQTLTITAVSNPIGGTVAINGTNIEFTPTANFNGAASFTYTLRDNGTTNSVDAFLTSSANVSFTVAEVNDAPTGVSDSLSSVAEDSGLRVVSFASLLGNDEKGPANESGQTLTITAVSNPVGGTVAINGSNVEFTPTADFNGTASFTYTLRDNGTTNGVDAFLTSSANVSFTVTEVNDAPTGVNDSLSSVAEDSGLRVISFATLLENDEKGPANESSQTLTITAVSNPVGGTVAINGSNVEFTPTADFNGTASFTYTLRDDGTTNSSGDFLMSTATASFTVTEVNDAPTGVNDSLTSIAEDSGIRVISFASLLGNDVKGPANESGQTLTITAVSNPIGGTVAINGTNIEFTPTANFNGAASFTYTLRDNGTTNSVDAFLTSSASVSFTIDAVNDEPSFTKGANETVLEDSGARTVNGWATNLSKGPSDESGQLLDFLVTNDNNSLFAAQPSISATGTLTYTPAANANGLATVTVRLHDNGGGDPNGDDTSDAQTFTITVTAVNDVPTFTAGPNVTTLGDAVQKTFAGWATNLGTGPTNESGQVLNFLVTTTSPALFSVAPAVSADGTLTYTPAINSTGTATVSVQIHDNGTTSNGGVDTSATQTFTITLTGSNKVPSFTKGANQTALEDSGAQTVNWATNISSGVGEAALGQQLDFIVTNNNNALFSTQPTISPTGVLTYTPAPNANGSATITVLLHDDGGTAGGGKNTSAAQTFTITVTAVNDAPSFRLPATVLDFPEDVQISSSGFAVDLDKGATNEAAQTLTFVVTDNTNAALFATQPAISATGVLTFKPALNSHGTANITIQLKDNGGVTNGGVDTSATQTFTIIIQAVNDAPSFTKGPNVTALEDAGPQTVTSWAKNISPGPADEVTAGQLVDFLITTSNDDFFATLPEISPAGTLTYETAPNASGAVTVTVRLHDDGGMGNGGVNTSAPQTFTITATAVNDLPTLSAVADQTIDEDTTTGPLAITIGDVETPAANLKLTATSSNTALIPVANIVFGGTGTDRTVTVTPAANKFGTAIITVKVTDANNGIATQAFQVTVDSVNDAPTITPIADVAIDEDKTTSALSVKINDVDHALAGLTVTATSSNEDLVPNDPARIVLGGSAGSRTLTLKPLPDQFGTTTITVTVTDGDGESSTDQFVLTVRPINDAPVVTATPLNVNEYTTNDTVVGMVTVSDADPDDTITLFAISAGNTGGAFKINAAGEILVNDATKIDFEALNKYTLTVKATDNNQGLGTGTKLTGTGTVVVNVVNQSFDFTVPAVDVANTVTVLRVLNNLVVRRDGVDLPEFSNRNVEDVTSLTIEGGSAADTVTLDTSLNKTGSPASHKFNGQIVVHGNLGNDILDASAITVTTLGVRFEGGGGNDAATGTAGNDSLFGGDGNDALIGGAGTDQLDGGTGDDILTGGTGNDTYLFDDLDVGAGDETDTLNELASGGTDVLDFSALTAAVTVNLTSETALATHAHRTVKTSATGLTKLAPNFENVIGGAGADSITGNAGINSLVGGNGNDTLRGGAGNDILNGGDGDDFLFGDAGNDTVSGGNDNDVLVGDLRGAGATAGSDSLMGDAGNDSILGGLGTDKLFGGDGDDLLFGEEANDTLTGGNGADSLSGGAGSTSLPDSVAGTDQVDLFTTEFNALLAALP